MKWRRVFLVKYIHISSAYPLENLNAVSSCGTESKQEHWLIVNVGISVLIWKKWNCYSTVGSCWIYACRINVAGAPVLDRGWQKRNLVGFSVVVSPTQPLFAGFCLRRTSKAPSPPLMLAEERIFHFAKEWAFVLALDIKQHPLLWHDCIYLVLGLVWVRSPLLSFSSPA